MTCRSSDRAVAGAGRRVGDAQRAQRAERRANRGELDEWVSLRSASSNVKVPLVRERAGVGVGAGLGHAARESSPAITGASLVPVIVTCTVAVSVRPLSR